MPAIAAGLGATKLEIIFHPPFKLTLWMTAALSQKPPLSVYVPPDIEPASGWPMVPLKENCPPVLCPPPPSTVVLFKSKSPPDCAITRLAMANRAVKIKKSVVVRFNVFFS